MTDYSVKHQCHALTLEKARCSRRGRHRYGARWLCSQHWSQMCAPLERGDLIGEGLLLWQWGNMAQKFLI